MGVRILDEDGTVLHEFAEGLGKALLYRLLGVAKFSGEAQAEIVLNTHVAGLAKALNAAIEQELKGARVKSAGAKDETEPVERMLLQNYARLGGVLRDAVLAGQNPWTSWTLEQKADFLKSVMCAPYAVSEEFVADYASDMDFQFERAKSALNPQ